MKNIHRMLTILVLWIGVMSMSMRVPGSEIPEPIVEKLEKDRVIQGIPLEKDTHVLFFDDQKTKVKMGTLSRDHRFGDYWVKGRTSFSIYAPNQLRTGFLREVKELQGVPVNAGKSVWFYPNGKLHQCTLDRPYTYKNIFFQAGTIIELTQEGSVLRGFLGKPVELAGIFLAGGLEVRLGLSGRLAGVTLDREIKIQGIDFFKGAILSFDEKGKLQSAGAEKNISIRGIDFLAGYMEIPGGHLEPNTVKFFPNGQVESGTLAKDQKVGGVEYQGGTEISFYKNGQVTEGILAKNQDVNGITCKEGKRIRFIIDGNINVCWLGKDQMIQGQNFFRAEDRTG